MSFLGLVFCMAAAVAAGPDSAVVDSVPVPATPQAVKYRALPGESRLTYFLKHPLHEVEGVNSQFECMVELGSDTLKSKVRVKAAVAGFNTGNSNRDSHTMEILDAFKFPFVEFVSDSVGRGAKGFRVYGQLTFHGVKKPVDFPVDWWSKDGKTHVDAEFTVKLSDHQVKRPTLMMVPTENVLRIKVQAVAKNP